MAAYDLLQVVGGVEGAANPGVDGGDLSGGSRVDVLNALEALPLWAILIALISLFSAAIYMAL
jgi:hypothetical protein